VVGMEGNGPACPDVREYRIDFSSDNAVSLDSSWQEWMGLDPGLLRFLQKGQGRRFRDYDLNSIE